MISIQVLILLGSFFFFCVLQINQKLNHFFDSRTLLRAAQGAFLLALITPVVFKALPHQSRPTLPMRYTFPVESVANSLSRPLVPLKKQKAEAAAVRLTHTSSLGTITFQDWVVAVFLLGASILFIRFFSRIQQVCKVLKGSHLLKRIGNVSLASSSDTSVPFSVLMGKTAWVIVPDTIFSSASDYLIAVKHELQHHRQKDTKWILFVEFIGCLLFFNPGFYLWKRIFSELQEFSCDETLIGREKVSLHDYGSCLLRVAEAALERRSHWAGTAPMASMFGSPKKIKTQLQRRVDMFTQHVSSRFKTQRAWILGTLMATFTFAVAYGATAKLEDKIDAKVNPGVLVLDPQIQKMTEEILKKSVKKFKATSGFVLVSEPATGRLLAAANTVNLEKFNGPEHWALKIRIEPASTMKAILAAKAVDLSKTKYDEVYDCQKGEMEIAGMVYKDWKPFEKITAKETVVQSSNVCGIKIAQKLKGNEMLSMHSDFGFGPGGTTQGFPEARSGDPLYAEETQNPQFAARLGVGYGFHVTPLEMVQAFGAIANGGNLMQPLMANAGESSIRVIRRVLSESVAKETKSVLEDVLIRGTAKEKGSKLYHLAGKTASSSSPWLWNSNEQGGETNVGSFIGFGPVEDPKILVYVAIYEPKDNPGHSAHGSEHGAPVFTEVAEKVLQHLKVPQDK